MSETQLCKDCLQISNIKSTQGVLHHALKECHDECVECLLHTHGVLLCVCNGCEQRCDWYHDDVEKPVQNLQHKLQDSLNRAVQKEHYICIMRLLQLGASWHNYAHGCDIGVSDSVFQSTITRANKEDYKHRYKLLNFMFHNGYTIEGSNFPDYRHHILLTAISTISSSVNHTQQAMIPTEIQRGMIIDDCNLIFYFMDKKADIRQFQWGFILKGLINKRKSTVLAMLLSCGADPNATFKELCFTDNFTQQPIIQEAVDQRDGRFVLTLLVGGAKIQRNKLRNTRQRASLGLYTKH